MVHTWSYIFAHEPLELERYASADLWEQFHCYSHARSHSTLGLSSPTLGSHTPPTHSRLTDDPPHFGQTNENALLLQFKSLRLASADANTWALGLQLAQQFCVPLPFSSAKGLVVWLNLILRTNVQTEPVKKTVSGCSPHLTYYQYRKAYRMIPHTPAWAKEWGL